MKSLYSSFYPDLRIGPVAGKEVTLTADQLARLRSVPGVRGLSRVVEEKAMLINEDYRANAYVKGVDDQYSKVSGVPRYLIRGNFDLGTAESPRLVMGAGVENAVGVQSDRSLSPVLVYTGRKGPIDNQDPLRNVSSGEANTSGSFLIQQDFDNKYVITNLDFVKAMLGMAPDRYTAAEIALQPEVVPEEIQAQLQRLLGPAYSVQTRYEQNQSLYSVMRAEKWVIYAILSLILVVAAFNMIGSLTMLVLEKKGDISVLHALGADSRLIQRIFLSEGLLLAFIGGVLGMLLALGLALAQIHFKLIPLEGGSFLIDYFPVKLSIADFLLVGLTVMVIALIASWIPARKAAGQQVSLRGE